jgi:hypothetical protein
MLPVPGRYTFQEKNFKSKFKGKVSRKYLPNVDNPLLLRVRIILLKILEQKYIF